MILKDNTSPSLVTPKRLAIVLLGILSLALLFLFRSYNDQSDSWSTEVFYCDAEQVEGEQFRTGTLLFNNALTQSDEQAFSGRYSSKLKKAEELQFGFGYQLKTPERGATYRASVWRYRGEGGKGFLVVAGSPESKFYKSEYLSSVTKNGWEYLEIVFSIPVNQTLDYIDIYVYSEGKQTFYFDDLKIEKTENLAETLRDFDLDTISLQLSNKALLHLKNKRRDAIRTGLLETTEADWVTAYLSDQSGVAQKIKLRLKGDWLDHLKGDKWSFRIKLSGGGAWKQLRHFSLHTPEARGFLHEWLLHRFFTREDVLTTRYEFVLLELNGKSLGVYALEEHFDKVLVESRGRREGVVIKFSEAGFWQSMKRQMQLTDRIQHGLRQNEKRMQAAEVLPFQEKTVLTSPVLTQQFETAQQLLQQFQFGQTAPEEVFDIDQMARYFAICDVMGAYHGISWHNLRFYFNPLTGKLEPIGFDGFETTGGDRSGFIGQGALNNRKIDTEAFHFLLFLNKNFTEKYIHYLWQFSSKEYLQNLLAETDEQLRFREKLLQSEFENYTFDANEWMIEALGVHLMMLPQNNISLKAYTQQSSDAGKQIKIGNVHSLPVEIIGYGTNENTMLHALDTSLILEGFIPRSALQLMQQRDSKKQLLDTITRLQMVRYHELQSPLQLKNLQVPAQATYLFYRPLGLDSILYSRISSWPSPYEPIVENTLFEPVILESNSLYKIDGQMIFFHKGNHVLDEPFVLPKGYRLHFEAGCRIDLQQDAFIISKSPVTMLGTEEEPVVIQSTDKTGRGFHVLEAKENSTLKHVLFDGLTTLNEKEHTLTGAVTFYEADVEFYGCTFRNNQCEDALNLIHSAFTMDRCLITQTLYDGLDADFCKGEIKRSRFAHTGNDGLDISGSVILIEDVDIESVGDKGISVGEDSDVSILSARIREAPIAIAVKDLSVLLVQSVQLIDCRQGFVAFQKKAEYGGSKIVVEQYEAKGVKKLYNVAEGCSLQLGAEMIRARR